MKLRYKYTLQNKESFKELEDLVFILFEIFFEILIQVVTERYNPDISVATNEEVIEYKLINKLSVAPSTWSDLVKNLFTEEVLAFY